MASTRSSEEDNFIRMSLLLIGISPRAARTLFDHEIAPARLDNLLKKQYVKLQKLRSKKIINKEQYNLLFPRFPGK